MPFIAAGRDKARVQAVVDKIPGMETADYEVVGVEHNVAALTECFRGAKVVCNMVGPFIKYGPETVEAALAAGCHYQDTTGEQDWVLEAKTKWGDKFAAKGLLLSPGVAQMYTTGEIAAQLCLETPGLDTLDILTLWGGFPTTASTQTIFTILKAKWYYLEQKQYKEWPLTQTFEVNVPGQHSTSLALPWGGTSHPVWFKDDPRVANVKVAAGVFAREVMEGVVATVKMCRKRHQAAAVSATGDRTRQDRGIHSKQHAATRESQSEPDRSTRFTHRGLSAASIASFTVTATTSRPACCRLTAPIPCCRRRRSRPVSRPACQAFGHRELLGILRASVW